MRVQPVNNSNPNFKGYMVWSLGVNSEIQKMTPKQKNNIQKMISEVRNKPYNITIIKNKTKFSESYSAKINQNGEALYEHHSKEYPTTNSVFNFIKKTLKKAEEFSKKANG